MKRSEDEFVVEHQKRTEKNRHPRAKELGDELRKVGQPEPEQPTAA